jgi:glycosyltransferase involved in cell wall biosynthesis
MDNNKIKLLFFIGSLKSGGKERRLIELLTYLNQTKKYKIYLLTKKKGASFQKIFDLDIEWIVLKPVKGKLDNFVEFFKLAKTIHPDIIHTWGSMQTVTAIPYKILTKNAKLVNSQITSAPPKINFGSKLINSFSFRVSDVNLANSKAGIEVFNPPISKSKVIYNGLNFNRFENLIEPALIRKEFGINKPFAVIMVASFSKNKDYERFFQVGIEVQKLRNDTIFLGVGYYDEGEAEYYERCVAISKINDNLKVIPGTSKVESLVNACDIGVLFSPNGEGISNSILEYMALGKPVIANNAGGTKEIVKNDVNGYLINNESAGEVAVIVNHLLNDFEKMSLMGKKSKERIQNDFSLSRMGEEFESVYIDLLK